MRKNLPAIQETRFDSWIREIPWRRKWLPIPVFLPEKFHALRSLLGYSSWGCKELGMTEQLTHYYVWDQSYAKDVSINVYTH